VHEQEYEVERSPRRLLNELAMTYAALPPIICAFGDSLRIVFGEADPPGNDAANIAGAA
jgi:hypothetical protein